MLKVMSYNIRNGGEERLSQLSNVIHIQSPDVVAVLETNDYERITKLASNLQMEATFGVANSPYHISWLSRIPIHHVINHRHAIFRKTMLELQVPWNGNLLHAFALHLAAGRDAVGERQRLREIQQALAIISNTKSDQILLLGDLNSIHPTDTVAIPPEGDPALVTKARCIAQSPRLVVPTIMEAGLIDGFRWLHPAVPGFTYTTSTPMARFDYFFAPPVIMQHIQRCTVLTSSETVFASDHFPLVVELR